MSHTLQTRFTRMILGIKCVLCFLSLREGPFFTAGYFLLLFMAFAGTNPAQAQSNLQCDAGMLRDLEQVIEDHNEHAYRLNKKFRDVWYHQGHVPVEVRQSITLEDITSYLTKLGQRRCAVLIHRFDKGYFRTWLITYRGSIICGTPRLLTSNDWKMLQPHSRDSLGIRGPRRSRTAVPLRDVVQGWESTLKGLSEILLPVEVQQELESADIETLIVVPVTVRGFDPSIDGAETSATHGERGRSALRDPSTLAPLSIGVVPFGALPFGDKTLIDRMSLVISPGFFSFARSPDGVRSRYYDPIVIGNPRLEGFQTLPGAEIEAKKVAELLQTDTFFLEHQATKETLERYLKEHAASIDYIHLATHGAADAVNPVDESYLVFSDGLLNARTISGLRRAVPSTRSGQGVEESLPLLEAKPLVVMSACQTALGKDFPAGTIGLARAWHWAGASRVVMSLWGVDDNVTKELMLQFAGHVVEGQPVDKALRSAMLKLRDNYPSPLHWAGFSVYGEPERF